MELKGQYIIRLYGPGGVLKTEQRSDNVVTDNGKDFVASFLQSAAVTASTNTMRYIAIGTGSGVASAGNTALGNELARQTGTVSYVSEAIYQVRATFLTGVGVGSISEYGLFSSNTTGTMVSRDVDSEIIKGASDTLEVIYQLTLS